MFNIGDEVEYTGTYSSHMTGSRGFVTRVAGHGDGASVHVDWTFLPNPQAAKNGPFGVMAMNITLVKQQPLLGDDDEDCV